MVVLYLRRWRASRQSKPFADYAPACLQPHCSRSTPCSSPSDGPALGVVLILFPVCTHPASSFSEVFDISLKALSDSDAHSWSTNSASFSSIICQYVGSLVRGFRTSDFIIGTRHAETPKASDSSSNTKRVSPIAPSPHLCSPKPTCLPHQPSSSRSAG